ncbi:unnamed protein product [Phaeothamnion confervicola]
MPRLRLALLLGSAHLWRPFAFTPGVAVVPRGLAPFLRHATSRVAEEGSWSPRRRRRRTFALSSTAERRRESPPSEEELKVISKYAPEAIYGEVGMRLALEELRAAADVASERRLEEERDRADLAATREAMRQRVAAADAAAVSAAEAKAVAGSDSGEARRPGPPCPLNSVADALKGLRPQTRGSADTDGSTGTGFGTGSSSDDQPASAASGTGLGGEGSAAAAARAADSDGSSSSSASDSGGGDDSNGGPTAPPPKRPRVPLPLWDVQSVGLLGRWKKMGGNLLLRPPDGVAPIAVIHFLGGAFVGAAPHLSYNYLLSGLADAGFIIVATPYPLGFDYLAVCDGILERFERAAVPLAQEYGALPVVGVGHSCGALLQLLITCLFPDTPRAANALLSFNNKPVDQAVPLFEEVVLPLVTQLLADGSGTAALGETLQALRETVLNLADTVARSELAPAVLEGELLPLVRQILQVVDQIPPLLRAVAEGTREFTPTPEETKDVARKMYRARRTLLVQFERDTIDETRAIKDVIQEGKTLLRMRRPMVDMDLRYEMITGTHVTPLTQDVFLPLGGAGGTPLDALDPLLGVRQSLRADFLKTVDELGRLMVDWCTEAVKPTSYMPR